MSNTRRHVGDIRALWTTWVLQKYPSIILLEASLCHFPVGAMHVGGGGLVCRRWAFFLLFFLFPSPNITTWPSLLLVFQLKSLIFLFLVFLLVFFVEVLFVFNFVLQSQFIKYYIFQFGPYSFDFYFFSCPFCKSFIGFQFHPLIQIDGIMFFNLIFIVLIFNFFSKPFCKSYYSFQFNPSIKILFLFFMSMLILILLIFLILLLNWFFLISSFNQI